jgi:LDH2 family malate/lactate/ureidoglycolate dehydrogenase
VKGFERISVVSARSFVIDVFRSLGVPEGDARTCADVLVDADRYGISSHGLNRLKPFYYDRVRKGLQSPRTELEVVRETPTTAVLDCHTGMGMVAGVKAMRMAMDMARDYGTGMTVVRNSTHYGIAGYYTRMAAEEGFIGMSGTNARPSVAPTFGTEGVLGTNPISIAFPTDEGAPFVLDCATSLAQRGKVEYYARLGKQVPPGWVVGEDGGAVTDPEEVLKALPLGKAALVPLGGIGEEGAGYKGYGLSAAVEVLSSALQGGAFLKAVTGMNVGHFFMAIDISAFREPAEFRSSAGEIMRQLRSSRRAPGQDRIYTAGEKERDSAARVDEEGIPLDPSLVSELVTIRDELGLSGHIFPFERSREG